jgi:predicted DsbA family dithiol-disulfide isomerase
VRLEQVAEEYGDRVELIWRSFMLRPEPEERPMDKFVRYTESWERPGSMEDRVTFNRWSGDHEPPSHSLPSSVAGKVAETFGPEAARRFHHGAMRAYFTDNRTISDRQVLLDIARSADIDPDEFDRRWRDDEPEYVNRVVTEHNEAIGAGITAVPSLVVGERYLVPGAVDVADYRQVIERYLADPASEENPASDGGSASS